MSSRATTSEEKSARRAAEVATLERIERAAAVAPNFQVRELLLYLKEHLFDYPFKIETWIEACELTPERGTELFEAATGWSPRDYLWDCRLEVAARMHLPGKLSLRQVSEAVGFAELQGFLRAFKRWSRHAPRRWLERTRRCPPPAVPEGGQDLLSSEFLNRALAGELTRREAVAVLKRVWEVRLARAAAQVTVEILEKRLAEELCEKRLAGTSSPRLVESCRRLVGSAALDEVWGAEGK